MLERSQCLKVSVENRAIFVGGDKSIIAWVKDYIADWWDTKMTFSTIPPRFMGRLSDVQGISSFLQCPNTHLENVETFFGGAGQAWRKDDGVIVIVEDRGVSYSWNSTSREIVVTGKEASIVGLDLNRLVRAALTAELEQDGWLMLHASCVVDGDRGAIVVGSKGSGKTTTALGLASEQGFQLLANDRCFVKVEQGRIRCLAWPGSVAVGLGLLNSLGWIDTLANSLGCSVPQHPSQSNEVVKRIMRRDSQPLFKGDREIKYEIMPRQLEEVFGIRLAREGYISQLVLPQFNHNLAEVSPQELIAENVLTGVGDGYPNFLEAELLESRVSVDAMTAVTHALCDLPVQRPRFTKDARVDARIEEHLAAITRESN